VNELEGSLYFILKASSFMEFWCLLVKLVVDAGESGAQVVRVAEIAISGEVVVDGVDDDVLLIDQGDRRFGVQSGTYIKCHQILVKSSNQYLLVDTGRI